MGDVIAASVVIATRDRRDLLRGTIAALAAQKTSRSFEVLVVDDGSQPPVSREDIAAIPSARLVRGEGKGPARARNLGISEARAPVVLFTDDDTLPDPGWLEAACAHLAAHPTHLGVEGPIVSLPFDPLYAFSVESEAPGGYLTANVAYRREVLERLDGFDRGFPFPHGEDLDLAYRVLELGEIGYAGGMRIRHVPRDATVGQIVRRARYAASDVRLLKRHRARYGRGGRLPPVLFVAANVIQVWLALGRREGFGLLRPPRRLARYLAMFGGQLAVAVAATVQRAVESRRTKSPSSCS